VSLPLLLGHLAEAVLLVEFGLVVFSFERGQPSELLFSFQATAFLVCEDTGLVFLVWEELGR